MHALRETWLEKEVKASYLATLPKLSQKKFANDPAVVTHRKLDKLDHIKVMLMLADEILQTDAQYTQLVYRFAKYLIEDIDITQLDVFAGELGMN